MSENNDKVNIANLINNEPMNDAEQAANKKIVKNVRKLLPIATTLAVFGGVYVVIDAAQNFTQPRMEAAISQQPYLFLSAGVLGILQIYASTRKSR